MERFTVSLDDDLLAQFDRYMQKKGYGNRSEAVRDILRDKLESERLQQQDENGQCVACLSYIYNHRERDLPNRVTGAQHDHHDLIRSTLHVHLDHENCMEVTVLEGPTREVRRFADALTAETGVRHGHLTAIPVDVKTHGWHGNHGRHGHSHVRPRT
jgi:CopG family nickel-responsive transcriptional regulator